MNRSLIWRINNPEEQLLVGARARAKKSGIEFNVNKYDIYIPQLCPLLEIPIVQNIGRGRTDNSPSLDRKDNSKGYTKDNVWVISDLANRMKNSASLEQLETFCKNVLKGKLNG